MTYNVFSGTLNLTEPNVQSYRPRGSGKLNFVRMILERRVARCLAIQQSGQGSEADAGLD